MCEQLVQGCYLQALGWEPNLRPSESQVQPPNHYAARPHPKQVEEENHGQPVKIVYMLNIKRQINTTCS